MYRRLRSLLIPLLLALTPLALPTVADAQILKYTGTTAVNADGSVTPTLTWCTEQVASPGTSCTGAPASACTATGDWTGAKAASGTQTLPATSTSKSYSLQCSWPGKDSITVNWVAPTLNDDGTPLTDLAGYKIYYSNSPAMSQNQVKDVKPGSVNSAVLGPGLAPGTYYIVMNSYTAASIESTKVPSPPHTHVLAAGATATQAFKVSFPNPPINITTQ